MKTMQIKIDNAIDEAEQQAEELQDKLSKLEDCKNTLAIGRELDSTQQAFINSL